MDPIIKQVKVAYGPMASNWNSYNWERLRYTLSCLPSKLGSVLDLGPGQGQFLWGMNFQGNTEELYALDIRKHTLFKEPDFSAKLLYGDVTKALPEELREKKFDLINAQEIFEHLDPDKLEETLLRLRKQAFQDQIIFTVPYQEKHPLYHHDKSCGHKQSFNDETIEKYFAPCIYTAICGKKWYYGLMSSQIQKTEKIEDPEVAAKKIKGVLSGNMRSEDSLISRFFSWFSGERFPS